VLARSHGDRLMAIAQRILRDVGRAEDAVQQTLEIACRELPSLRDPDRIDAYNAPFIDLKAPANQIVLFHLAGPLNEHPEDDGAMGNREAAFACVIQSTWGPDSGAGDANREWVRSTWQALKPYSTGGNHVDFQTDDEADERTVESYRNNYERLGSVKATYDPSNLFRVNRNIRRSVHSSGSPVARCRFADRLMQPADLRLGPRPS